MKVSDLSAASVEKVGSIRYDSFIEKHEGPWDYRGCFEYDAPEFLEIAGRSVLLPISAEQHGNLEILRCVVSEGADVLTVFLRDRTWEDHDMLSGRLAVCERVPGETFYVATVYHEWFTLPPLA